MIKNAAIATQKEARVRRFRDDESGASAIGFGIIAVPFFMMIMGILEFGGIMFTTSLMEGALRDAARFGITGEEPQASTRLDKVRAIISERTVGLVDIDKAQIDVLVYPSFTAIGKGEDFVDGNSNGQYDPGETYTDANGNGTFDADLGSPGPGGAGDVVLYRIQYDWPLMTPMATPVIGTDGLFPLTASLAVRNEPYDTQDAGPAPAPGG